MAVTLHCNRIHNTTATGHSQLVRSLERILEEANLSGELILTNRKLKDFPKAATKYNLSDTVIADLSRNRFCELPEEVTTFAFLETLLLYHNTIRHIPESVKHLTLLTYLDLRSNQLSSLPREICFLPLQVLLVSNNRLLTLPDELGRMDRLTDLDASYNQLTALPARIGELRNLKSFSLRNNQILYLPRELACLNLISLDVSNNRIASLPLEIRQMTTLVEFNLGNNPLTSPPASLCVRGLVHIFKYLETQATKDEKGCRAGGNYDGYTTLRRAPKQHVGSIFEPTRNPRGYQNDYGYSTCDGIDKRWSHDLPNRSNKNDLSSPRKALASTTIDNFILDTRANDDVVVSKPTSAEELSKDNLSECSYREHSSSKEESLTYNNSGSTSSGSTPEDDMLIENQAFMDRGNKDFGNIQTYKEYKEALKQQRNQEISSVYKIKAMNEVNGTSAAEEIEYHGKEDNPYANNTAEKQEDSACVPKKPVQKVIPSRNTEHTTAIFKPKLKDKSSLPTSEECLGYIKPSSPMNILPSDDSSTNNNVVTANGGVRNKLMPSVNGKQQQLSVQTKSNRTVTWNHDLPPEKLSFTMRREFDRQREETELLMQLRNIIQIRLKTMLPEDMASALTDGIILCHLANYVRPRSVASIHVPSPGVSKLTMARCRKNVDNFLEACRKIGVDEELICSSDDIVAAEDEICLSDDETKPPMLRNASAVLRTVSALLLMSADVQNSDDFQQFHQHQDQFQQRIMEEHQPPATNMQLTEKWENKVNTMREVTTINKEQIDDETLTARESQLGKFLRHAKVKTFQKIKSNLNNNINLKFISHSGKEYQLQTIEETEADSYQVINEKISPVVLKVNDLNSIKSKLLELNSNNNNVHNETNESGLAATQCITRNDSGPPEKIVAKRIDYFEDRPIMRVCANDDTNVTSKNIYSIYQTTNNTNGEAKTNKDDETINHDFNVLTIVLSCVFIVTFVLLVIFPIPD